LSDEERRKLLPSGQQALFDNRVGWARTYQKKAGLIESTRRGYFRITQRGLEVLKQNPSKINIKFLMQFEEFREFKKPKPAEPPKPPEGAETPEEELEGERKPLKKNSKPLTKTSEMSLPANYSNKSRTVLRAYLKRS
jgi:restriction system protein